MVHKILRALILLVLLGSLLGGTLAQENIVESTATGLSQQVIVLIIAAAVIPLIIVAIGIFIFVRVIQPSRRKRPFYEAIELIRNKKYAEALPILSKSESQLPNELRRKARFYIAFCNMMTDKLEQAKTIFTALHSEDETDLNTIYALAYINVMEKKFENAIPFLDELKKNQWEKLHTKKLLALVAIHQGYKALSENRFDRAATFFSEVNQYGEYTEAIPSNLRNRQSVLGTQALHDGDIEVAREHFESLRASLAEVAPDERKEMEINVYLGLALISWLETPENFEQTDEILVNAIKLLDPEASLTSTWPQSISLPDFIDKIQAIEDSEDSIDSQVSTEDMQSIIAADSSNSLVQKLSHMSRLMRDIQFVRGMAVLRTWRQLEGELAHESIQKNLDLSLERLARVYEIDPSFASNIMVVGLLKYYLYPGNHEEHEKGVELLKLSRQLGMNDPETRKILLNIEAREKERKNAVDKYIWLLDKYLNDATVEKEIRLALLEKLITFQRIQDWEKQPDLAGAESVEPTLADMRRRTEMLMVRVEELLKIRERDDAVKAIEEISNKLVESSEKLQQQVSTIQNHESALLEATGNELLKD